MARPARWLSTRVGRSQWTTLRPLSAGMSGISVDNDGKGREMATRQVAQHVHPGLGPDRATCGSGPQGSHGSEWPWSTWKRRVPPRQSVHHAGAAELLNADPPTATPNGHGGDAPVVERDPEARLRESSRALCAPGRTKSDLGGLPQVVTGSAKGTRRQVRLAPHGKPARRLLHRAGPELCSRSGADRIMDCVRCRWNGEYVRTMIPASVASTDRVSVFLWPSSGGQEPETFFRVLLRIPDSTVSPRSSVSPGC